MGLLDPFSLALVSAGIFAGAVVSGLAGFAFSAVAGIALLHVLPPTEAVPLMMACSIVTQLASFVALRRTVRWRGSPLLIAGGLVGVIPALYLLNSIDAQIFRVGFGFFLTGYAVIMLLRRAAGPAPDAPCRLCHAIIGFGGGLIGGLTAMPGALPTIWCDLRGVSKDQRRALVQPYIIVLQLFGLLVMLTQHTYTEQAMINWACSLPALAAGVAVGLVIFRRIKDATFRSTVLVVLFFAGLLLAV